MRAALAFGLSSLLLSAFSTGCKNDTSDPPAVESNLTTSEADVLDPDDAAEPDEAAEPNDTRAGPPMRPDGPPGCDPLSVTECALPWPSNLYLVEDAARPTGFTLTFGPESLPKNNEGKHIEPGPWTRMDGYGLGTPLMVHFPSVDVAGLATEYDTDPSLSPAAPIVWLAVDGDQVSRVPYSVELDARTDDPSRQLLVVRPAIILEEGRRYVVAFRGLAKSNGDVFPPSDAFRLLRDGLAAGNEDLEWRTPRFEDIFGVLEAQGVARSELQLAWDFVTASSDGLHGHMRTVVQRAFDATGEQGAELLIDEIQEFTQAENAHIAYELRGRFKVPHFMQKVPLEGDTVAWIFNRDEAGLPAQNGWLEPPVWIRIPRSALDGEPVGLVMYGHGQNGSGTQVRKSSNDQIANEHRFIYFATDMLGMSSQDVATIALILFDVSRMPWLGDRLHQGVVNHLLLARGMKERFESLPEAQNLNLNIDKADLHYSGISQGGIYGATFTALSADITRAHLGVPGHTYTYMITRSKNFAPFYLGLDISYPDPMTQSLVAGAAQLLWDGTDPVSYYRRLAQQPFEGLPKHDVLLVPAKGDPQVPVPCNEVVARTQLGIPIMAHYDVDREVSGVEEAAYPRTGSGVVLYAFGDEWPAPSVNLPPVESDLGDPHNKPHTQPQHMTQMAHFFRTGDIIDVCGGDGCTPD